MPSARTLLALALLTPWALWALTRTLGLDRFHPVVAALTFTPYVAATAVVPVLGALALRRRGVAAGGLVVAALLGLAVLPRALGGERVPAGADGPTLRVMSVNVHAGGADMAWVLRLARAERADVVSFQELTPEALRRFDAAGGRRAFPGRAVEPRPGAGGSGLLARRPLRNRAPDDATAAEQPAARLALPGAAPVVVKAVHPRPPITEGSEADWQASLARFPRPRGRGPLRVLAGDFNATLDHRALRSVLAGGYVDAADATGNGLTHTWPEGRARPPITIDHVLLDERLGVREFSVHDVPGSDHRAIVAELVLPSSRPPRRSR